MVTQVTMQSSPVHGFLKPPQPGGSYRRHVGLCDLPIMQFAILVRASARREVRGALVFTKGETQVKKLIILLPPNF